MFFVLTRMVSLCMRLISRGDTTLFKLFKFYNVPVLLFSSVLFLLSFFSLELYVSHVDTCVQNLLSLCRLTAKLDSLSLFELRLAVLAPSGETLSFSGHEQE